MYPLAHLDQTAFSKVATYSGLNPMATLPPSEATNKEATVRVARIVGGYPKELALGAGRDAS
jgi:hypothetical protein